MRKDTKAEVVSALARTRCERDLLEYALAAAMTDGWEATERATLKGDSRYTFRLCRSAGALGGVVLVRFDALGTRQAPQFSVYSLDSMSGRQWPLEFAPAMDRIRAAARAIQVAA